MGDKPRRRRHRGLALYYQPTEPFVPTPDELDDILSGITDTTETEDTLINGLVPKKKREKDA
jgi:hypothetical protein